MQNQYDRFAGEHPFLTLGILAVSFGFFCLKVGVLFLAARFLWNAA